MEGIWRWVALTSIAPISWGATYYVTRHGLPADAPVWGAALRALPAGMVLLLLARRLPRGLWWWRAAVLGVLNVGAFFLLVYLAAHLLPSSIAASIMATSPLALAAFAWLLAGERPSARMLLGAVVGIAGVLLVVGAGTGTVDRRGVVASVAAMTMSSIGYVLTKRWREQAGSSPVTTLEVTAWQTAAGGVLLAVAALVSEGSPPALDVTGWVAVAFVSLVATALAMYCWFAGLARLSAGTVGIVGLLNPVTGVLLGALVAGEHLGAAQLAGIVLVLAGLLLGRQRSLSVRACPHASGIPPVVADRSSTVASRCHGSKLTPFPSDETSVSVHERGSS